mgnify:CR=1 FL=1
MGLRLRLRFTREKPTGYDRSGKYVPKMCVALHASAHHGASPPPMDPHRCVPKMSVAQIKAKFRFQQTVRKKQQLASAAGGVRPSTCCGLPCGLCERDETWWDRMLGIDVLDNAHDVDVDGAHGDAHAGQQDGVVDEARKARVKQLRKERLPEATLLPIVHSKEAHLEGKLQIHGDPSSMYMML